MGLAPFSAGRQPPFRGVVFSLPSVCRPEMEREKSGQLGTLAQIGLALCLSILPCGFGSLPCKNEGNDSQSASQATIKINGWFAKCFAILGWTAAVLYRAREHSAVLRCCGHQIKQSSSHLAILTRRQTPGMPGAAWGTILVPCSGQFPGQAPQNGLGRRQHAQIHLPLCLLHVGDEKRVRGHRY